MSAFVPATKPDFHEKQVGDWVQNRLTDRFGRVIEVSMSGWRSKVEYDEPSLPTEWLPSSELVLISRK